MVTLHPTASKLHNGYRPMVIVRNPRGQLVGSRVAAGHTYATKEEARNYARQAAQRVMQLFDFIRVA